MASISRSRYLLEQSRKKELEEKKRQAHAASIFEENAKKIEAAFEVTRQRREEDRQRELQIELKLQRDKFERDRKRAEDVRMAFSKQQEAAREYALKDIIWRKKCYPASLMNNELPFEPSLSGILIACCVSSAYESVGDEPVPRTTFRHVRALFPQVVDYAENEAQSVNELAEEVSLRKSGYRLGPTITAKHSAIYITVIGPSPKGWGDAMVECCRAWFASSVDVQFLPSICPPHRWKGILVSKADHKDGENNDDGDDDNIKKKTMNTHQYLPIPKSKSGGATINHGSLDNKFQNEEMDLFSAHDFLGRVYRENSNLHNASLLLAFSLCDMLNPIAQAKILTKTASNRIRPRFVSDEVALEAKQAHEAEMQHAADMSEYAKVIAPTATPHWSMQSLDMGQCTGVISLYPPHRRKKFKRSLQSTLNQKPTSKFLPSISNNSNIYGNNNHTPSDHVDCSVDLSEDQYLRMFLGSLPYAAASLLGFKPCQYGYSCGHRPAESLRTHCCPIAPLHCCPVCLVKLSTIFQDSKCAFSPVARERLFVSCFNVECTLKHMKSTAHEDLEWSRALLSAVELEVYGSEPDASAAYASWKRSTPKPFEKFRHKFKSLHDDGTMDEHSLSRCEQSWKKSLVNYPTSAPPYPSMKRMEQPRMKASLKEERVDPWRAGPGMLWNEHSLVRREVHNESKPGEFWKDPLRTKFGGIAHGQSPVKQFLDKFNVDEDEKQAVGATEYLEEKRSPSLKGDTSQQFSVDSQESKTHMSSSSSLHEKGATGSGYHIKRAGGMYAYGSFELARARIIPSEQEPPPPPPEDDAVSTRSTVTFNTQNSFGSPSSSRNKGKKSKRGRRKGK